MYDDQMLVKMGGARIICTKRARKLRKRGEEVWWSTKMDCWLWSPTF